MNTETEQKQFSINRVATVLVFLFLGCVVVCLSQGFLLEIPFYLATGFAFFAVRVLPQIRVRWEAIGVFAGIVVVLGFSAHFFLRWLWSGLRTGEMSSPWKPRWTGYGVGLVVIAFCAGIAAVGMGHQVAWLINSPFALVESRGLERANRVKCASNLRTIGQGLKIYVAEHGGVLPPDFSYLVRHADTSAAVFVCPSSNVDPIGEGSVDEQAASVMKEEHCSYVYLAGGLRDSELTDEMILAYEPLENHEKDGANVLFADGHVDFFKAEDFRKLMADPKHRLPETRPATGPAK